MDQARIAEARGFLLKVGALLVLSGIVCNPAVLSSLAADGRVDGASRGAIHLGQGLLIALGIAAAALRSNVGARRVSAVLLRRAGRVAHAVPFLIYLLLISEAASYLLFHHGMPADLRRRALFTAGLGTEVEAGLTANVMPYLWSNYLPNPASDQVNGHGWRFGGGPRSARMRILCIGGSTTWSDHASSPEASYPARLQSYLNERGFSVDVVSASAPYYSSAELVGLMAFKAVHTRPDLVLIHTGGNDVEPLLSPRDYQPDYSHWRTAGIEGFGAGSNDLFATAWKVPSWTVRLVSGLILRPDGWTRAKLGKQLTRSVDGYLATNDLSGREPAGLESNIRSLIAISRAHGAKPVAILFKVHLPGLRKVLGRYADRPDLLARGRERAAWGYRKSNEAIRRVAAETNVPVIPFDSFSPTVESAWTDHQHLDDRGLREKAAFLGEWLIASGLLDEAEGGG